MVPLPCPHLLVSHVDTLKGDVQKARIAGIVGYRTKRVGFMVTFRLVGAEKSVLKLVGANLKDGQNVLVL